MKNQELEAVKNKIPKEISLSLEEIKIIKNNYEEFMEIMEYSEFYLINIIENRDCFFIRKTEAEIEDLRDYYELDMGYETGTNYLIKSIEELEHFEREIYIEEDDEDKRYNG